MGKTMTNSRHRKHPIALAVQAISIPKSAHIKEAEMTESAVLELDTTDDDQREADADWLSDLFRIDLADKTHTLPVFGEDVRAEQAALVRVIGARMREARELTNMSQVVAATRLGYRASGKLAKIENASDTCSVPAWTVLRAARLYDVSVDFLYGLTEDFDSTARRPVATWLADALEVSRRRDLELIRKLHDEVRLVSKLIPEVLERARDVEAAITSLRAINPSFDDFRGGARVVGTVERLLASAVGAMNGLRRLDRKMGLPAR